jgi:hypothetical protein
MSLMHARIAMPHDRSHHSLATLEVIQWYGQAWPRDAYTRQLNAVKAHSAAKQQCRISTPPLLFGIAWDCR